MRLYIHIFYMDLTNFEVHDKIIFGGENMMEYLLAKIRWEELIREAEKERLLREAKKQIKVLFGSNVQKEQVKQGDKLEIRI